MVKMFHQKNTTTVLIVPNHTQVLFELASGEMVTVDEGLFDLLTKLKQLGVNTQYSCQQDARGAYFVADMVSFEPVLHMLYNSNFVCTIELSHDEFGDRATVRWHPSSTQAFMSHLNYYLKD